MANNGLYEFLADEKKCKCLTCGKILSGTSIFNIKRHYALKHKMKIPGEKARTSGGHSKFAKNDKTCSVNINMNKNEFIKCCMGLVTVKSLPLSLFDDQMFFKNLIKPYERKFGTRLSSRNMVEILGNTSVNIWRSIKKKLEGKLISLKVDIASRMGKSVLGINVQYIEEFEICIYTLGMIPLQQRHNTTYIKEHIISCLENYDLDIRQVYSTTTDNGANVLKANEILQEAQEIDNFLGGEENNDTNDEELMQLALESVFLVVPCAAYTIQLAAFDVLQTLSPILDDVRSVVENIRSMIDTDSCNIQMPVLDNLTSWHTTFEMISSLNNSRCYIEQNCDVKDINWDFVADFTKAFQPLATYMKQMQTEQYIVGDLYRDWLSCELELRDIGATVTYAMQLHDAMQVRKQMLMSNKAFLAALYLDPRFNFKGSLILSWEQKLEAVNHLLKTYENMMQLENSQNVTPSSPKKPNLEIIEYPSTSNSPFSRLEKHISEEMVDMSSTAGVDHNLRQKLDTFSSGRKVAFDTNILAYWKMYNLDKDLKKLAEVILAVPATRVSVERAFSALSLVLTKQRSKLSDTTLDNLLLTKLNFDLL